MGHRALEGDARHDARGGAVGPVSARPYSERLLFANTPAAWTSWTVPAGMRAVIKSVVLTNNSGILAQIGVFAVGAPLYLAVLQAASAHASPTMTLPLYAGESIDAYTQDQFTSVWVGGFLFEDTSGRAAPPGEYRIASDPPDYLVLREEVERAARREPHG